MKTFWIFMRLWLFGIQNKATIFISHVSIFKQFFQSGTVFYYGMNGTYEQLITLSLTTSHQIMTPLNLIQFYSRRTEIEGGCDWQETLNYQKPPHFGLNSFNLQITSHHVKDPASTTLLQQFKNLSYFLLNIMGNNANADQCAEKLDLYKHASAD